MRTYKIRKIWKGQYASVRDYVVYETMRSGEDLRIVFDKTKEEMIVPNSELIEGTKSAGSYQSKIDGQVYSLIDFLWKPITESQKRLF